MRADRVEIRQGGADHVEADHVSVIQGGITSVDARDGRRPDGRHRVRPRRRRLGQARWRRAGPRRPPDGRAWLASGAAFAREANLHQAYARSVLAQDVRIDQGLVGTVLTGRATFDRPSAVLMLIAGRVDGPVKALLDWRGALAFGAAFGLAWGLVRGVVRRR